MKDGSVVDLVLAVKTIGIKSEIMQIAGTYLSSQAKPLGYFNEYCLPIYPCNNRHYNKTGLSVSELIKLSKGKFIEEIIDKYGQFSNGSKYRYVVSSRSVLELLRNDLERRNHDLGKLKDLGAIDMMEIKEAIVPDSTYINSTIFSDSNAEIISKYNLIRDKNLNIKSAHDALYEMVSLLFYYKRIRE